MPWRQWIYLDHQSDATFVSLMRVFRRYNRGLASLFKLDRNAADTKSIAIYKAAKTGQAEKLEVRSYCFRSFIFSSGIIVANIGNSRTAQFAERRRLQGKNASYHCSIERASPMR